QGPHRSRGGALLASMVDIGGDANIDIRSDAQHPPPAESASLAVVLPVAALVVALVVELLVFTTISNDSNAAS
ncbi:hypothetical protein SAMN06264364_1361, partial [Quadrisphaera granulorum]